MTISGKVTDFFLAVAHPYQLKIKSEDGKGSY